jgi:hypothetical protein
MRKTRDDCCCSRTILNSVQADDHEVGHSERGEKAFTDCSSRAVTVLSPASDQTNEVSISTLSPHFPGFNAVAFPLDWLTV